MTAYQNDKIGIIGANGQGKSTLLKLIAGNLAPDEGSIQREVDFNYFPQMKQVDEQENLELLDWDLMRRLSVPQNQVETLSGGEAAKFRLAQVLSSYQMGLMLDEPTTHLDSASIQTLVDDLQYYYGTMLFVSHDRYFLNQLATKIWEVENGKVTEYIGNFDDYTQQKNQLKLENERAADNYLKERKRLEAAISEKKRQAEKSKKVSAKKRQQNIRPDRLASSKQKDTIQKNLQKSAKAMESRLSQLEERTVGKEKKKIIFPPSKTVEIHNKYPIRGDNFSLIKGDKPLFTNCDFHFGLGRRIAIVGANGSGKSSLLNAILAEDEGIILSPKVVFSVYQQMSYKIAGTESVLNYLLKQTEYPEALVRSILNNLGFAQSELVKSVNALSGGEATRIQIALLFIRPSNVLILDEPTNFIDLNTIEALEKLIQDYQGTVLFTSHDDYFVKNVAEDIYKIENQQLKLLAKD